MENQQENTAEELILDEFSDNAPETQENTPELKEQKLLINNLYYESDDFGKFTEDEVKNAKIKYGKRLRYLKVTTPDGISEFIIKKPSRATSSAVHDAIEKKNQDLASEIMLSNCVVIGDLEDIEEDAVVFAKVTSFLTSMVKEAELEAKKL
ncbi:hypothetical protein [Chryseobacterium mulctrae]|uniref:hypothetical protein n=1 Tax=Chryseobacterium mulctrae TaxID=2576777 RepID=UPI0011165A40|nr:hypothetical protein [Chryseobacterium mulctrae]